MPTPAQVRDRVVRRGGEALDDLGSWVRRQVHSGPLGWAKLLWRLKAKRISSFRVPLLGVRRQVRGGYEGARIVYHMYSAIHAALQAAEKGVPFLPLRGLIGSDVLANRPDWRVTDNPFANHDPIVLLPAITPDVTLFHAPMADRDGNVWIGRRRELMTMAHAARKTLVTVEEMHDGSLLDDERLAAGTIPALYVSAVAESRRGAWPLGLDGRYEADTAELERYVRAAASVDGFRRYLRDHDARRAA